MPRNKGDLAHPKAKREAAIAAWKAGESLYVIAKRLGFKNDVCLGALISYWRKKDPTIPYRYDKGAPNSC